MTSDFDPSVNNIVELDPLAALQRNRELLQDILHTDHPAARRFEDWLIYGLLLPLFHGERAFKPPYFERMIRAAIQVARDPAYEESRRRSREAWGIKPRQLHLNFGRSDA